MSEDQNNMRYSQMSEEQAAKYFEQRKQQLMGSLIDQYKSTSSQKKFSSTKVEPQQADSHFVIFNQKRQDSPKQLYGINSNKQKTGKPKKAMPQKKLQFQADEQPSIQVKDQGQQQNESEQTILVEPEPMQQHPSKEQQQQQQNLPSQQKGIRKVLLSDIGNIDLEIQRLTKEMSSSIIVQENSIRQNSRMESKPYYEMRQRPSSKESKISDASYTKRASCFKGVVRSQSLKKLIQPKQESRPTYNIMQVRSASEKKVDKSIVNKTITIESEQQKVVPKKSQPPQSERKAPAKPVIQMNRSQSKQDTPVHVREKQKEQNDEQNEQKNSALSRQTPLKSNLKVSFTWKPKLSEANSTKGNQSASYFHNPKDSSSSQQSFFKNKCVEAQIEEAVQLYNNLKSLMNNKTNVLQLRKDANIMPRKTADFFNPKVYDYKQRNGEAIAY